jgi:outer membrane protein assembly factor BamE
MPSRSRLAVCSLVAALAATGCASLQSSDNFLGVVTPYRVEVVQGNVVTKEQAEAVKPGMSRTQVRDILGSPLLADAFHADRWDYVFTIRRQGAEPQLRRLVARFDGETLKSLDTSSELPAERDFVASIDTFKTSRQSPPLALTDDQVKALPVPPKPPAAVAEPIGPTRSFPPLEAAR